MAQPLSLMLAFAAGALTGVIFFGGLWVTVNAMGQSRRPVPMMLAGMAARFAVACGAFYLIASRTTAPGFHLVAAVAGFMAVRLLMVPRRLPRRPEEPRG